MPTFLLEPEQVSGFRIRALCANLFKVDGGAVFGTTPKTVWSQRIESDALNRIRLGSRCLLLQRDQTNLLIDAGLGEKGTPQERQRHALDEDLSPPLTANLQTLGLSRLDITDILCTHLHFDHAGGLTYRDREGRLLPTFPRARHWVQAAHLDWARGTVAEKRGSFPQENIEPLVRADLFSLLRGQESLMAGLQVLPLNGHTKAMQAVLVEGRQPLFFPGDLIPTTLHLDLQTVMAYDIDPITTLLEKENMLERATKNRWFCYFQHQADEEYGWLDRFGGNYCLGKSSGGDRKERASAP